MKGYTLDPDTVQVSAFIMGDGNAGGSSQSLTTTRYFSSHEDDNTFKRGSEVLAGEFSILSEQVRPPPLCISIMMMILIIHKKMMFRTMAVQFQTP